MFPREDPKQSQSRDEALGRLWDALQESGTLGSPDIESEDIDTITRLHGAEDISPPEDELIQRMWGSIEIGTLGSPSMQFAPASLNGHHAASAYQAEQVTVEAAETSLAAGSRNTITRLDDAARHIARTAAIAACAGFIAGFITLGGGGRIAMRIAAMLSADELQGTITENQERVGEMTLSGTFGLMMTGGMVGIGLGLGFVLIRSYLPESGWRRILTTGAVFFAVCGFVTLEGGGNADYEKFGIAGLNICLFTLLPLLFGLMVAPVTDWLERHVNAGVPRLSRSPGVLLTSAVVLFGTLCAIPGLLFLLVLPPLQLFIVTPVLVLIVRSVGNRFSIPPGPGLSLWLNRVVLALPCIIGLTLTTIAVGRIM